MRVTQLRQADLNLLVVFSVLAEERNVSRAAKRLLLSQPAVSRALQRMRDTFHDDLLVRTAKGYEPTPQGERVLRELEIMLPKLDRLISGSTFDPKTEHVPSGLRRRTMRPRSSLPFSVARFLPAARQVRFTFASWRGDAFEDLTHGRLDLALIGDEGHVPSPLLTEVIYEEELVCIVAADAPYQRQLTLKQYLAAEHIGVDVLGGHTTYTGETLGSIWSPSSDRDYIAILRSSHTVHSWNETDSDRTPAIRKGRSRKSEDQSSEGTGRDNRLQVSDDMASQSEHRCRTRVAAGRD